MYPIIFSFVFTLIFIICLIPMANKIGLVDVPNHRKSHIGSVPLVGGVAIYIVILGYFVVLNDFSTFTLSYIAGCSLLFIVGIFDDMFDIRVRYRLLIQIASALIIIFWSGVYIDYIGTVTGPISLGYFGIIFTVCLFMTNINAYNMVDGIDGLLGALSLVSMSTLAVFLWLADSSYTAVPIVIIAALTSYLIFNFKISSFIPKIFMGDAGAMLLGFSVSWLIVISVVVEDAFRPIIILYIISVPFIDMVFTIFNRIRKGQSPIRPQRDHIHHRLMNRGFSSHQTVGITTVLAMFIATIGFLGEYFKISDLNMLLSFVFIMICFTYYFIHTSMYK